MSRQMPFYLTILTIAAGLLLAGAVAARPPVCAQGQNATSIPMQSRHLEASPTPTNSLGMTIIKRPTRTPTATKTSTITRTPTPTETLVPNFPGLSRSVTSFEDYPQAIVDALNAGATFVEIEQALSYLQAEVWPRDKNNWFRSTDLTGDGLDDLAISINQYSDKKHPWPSTYSIIILVREEERFRLVDIYYHDSSHWPDYKALPFYHVGDLNANGIPELVIHLSSSTVRAPAGGLMILERNGEEFENRLDGANLRFNQPEFAILGPSPAGFYDIVVYAGTYPISYTLSRLWTWVWSYNTETNMWEISEVAPNPSNHRVHTLHDADRAADEGDFARALRLYRQVIEDDNLDDMVFPCLQRGRWPEWVVRGNLESHARYKMVVAYAYLGDMEAAHRAFRGLWAAETHGVVQYHYALMAFRFLAGYEQNHIMRLLNLTTDDNLSAGCEAAIAYAEAHVSFLEHVGSENYGDGEAQYRAVDMCPSSLKTAGYHRPSGYVPPHIMPYMPQPTSRPVVGAWPTPTATVKWTPTAIP